MLHRYLLFLDILLVSDNDCVALRLDRLGFWRFRSCFLSSIAHLRDLYLLEGRFMLLVRVVGLLDDIGHASQILLVGSRVLRLLRRDLVVLSLELDLLREFVSGL